MKTNVFKVTAGNTFQAVIIFLRKQLGLKAEDPLVRAWIHASHVSEDSHLTAQFTYINAAFAPAPDDIVGNLFKVPSNSHVQRLKQS